MKPFEFHCSRLGFEPMWMTDRRKWSQADYIMWLKVSEGCSLKCEYCHEYVNRGNKWLAISDIEMILRNIKGKVYISPSLGDILLSPFRFDIFDYLKDRGHRINLFSYLPQYVSLPELEFIMTNYDFPLCWSLHGENNKVRDKRFEKPHSIEDVLPILNKRRNYLNRVYLFANHINQGNIESYEQLFERLNPDSCEVAITYLVDYKKSTVLNVENIKIPIKHKTVLPDLDILFAIYGREFRYESSSRRNKNQVRKTNSH